MRLPALIHLVESARSLSHCQRVRVLGSSALLASFPGLGDPGQPLELSYDADLLVEPCDERIAAMLHEAIGEGSLFAQQSGYHADILRPTITETLPPRWEQRLVKLNASVEAHALAPQDLVAVKLRLGRPKDVELCRQLFRQSMVNPTDVKERLDSTALPEAEVVRVYRLFRELTL